MDINVFDKVINELREFDGLETIMFGGFGEPTFHKDFIYNVGILSAEVASYLINQGYPQVA